MTRTLFLHIGSHKTGTTSIQHFLAENTEALAARGYAYPVNCNGVNIGTVLGGVDEEEEGEMISAGKLDRKTRIAIRQLAAIDEPNVIASTESFSYVTDRDLLDLFHKRLQERFDQIRVITYLRRQDQFAISHHQEGANPQLKPAAKLHGHRPTALPETSELQRKYLDYETRIGMWADVFGDENMVIRLYDRALLKNGDSVADFLQIVGLGDMDPTVAATRNVSMGFAKAKMGHLLHQVLPDQAARAAVLSRLPHDGRLLPRREDARRFVEPYLEGNRRLNARFKLSPQPDLFSDDFSMYPEEGHETWTEDSANAAIYACLEVIKELSANSLDFAFEDYSSASRALEETNPELSLRYLQAALTLRPTSKKLKARVEKLQSALGLAKTEPEQEEPAATALSKARTERRAAPAPPGVPTKKKERRAMRRKNRSLAS